MIFTQQFSRALCALLVATLPVYAADSADFRAGSKKIAARIDAILRAQNPMTNPFRNTERAGILRKAAEKAEKESPNSFDHVSAESQLAIELLRSGEMEESLKSLDKVEEICAVAPTFAGGGDAAALKLLEAVNYLRVGEVQHCFALHGPDSCLLPFRGTAFQKKPYGSREAIRALTEFVYTNPRSL